MLYRIGLQGDYVRSDKDATVADHGVDMGGRITEAEEGASLGAVSCSESRVDTDP
jgi:hypothetical protein